MLRVATVGLAFVAACGCNASARNSPGRDPEPAPPPSVTLPGLATGPTASIQPEPTEPSSACAMTSPTVRLRINAGQALHTGTGLEIGNEGASHDNFGPAGFDINISLVFRRDGQEVGHMSSFRDRRTQEVFGHCYRVVDGDLGVVLLEVSQLPPPLPEEIAPDASPPSAASSGKLPP